ncbi:hypothetical protein D7Y13_12625 [Corallococcus praedator]|uniref:Uncharacterized protein n=1 Tax=Corallococcus praedator TaxID=2316724 RepID=A0ABX9QKC7_9BACT|nr:MULTISPECIES: hypothetical protein [Corallococcus]RKH20236.1 hypothetical protein D7X74_04660 [Corallococcus sp. CA047B]RKH32543.1 hypothetical protein D7X75_15315 [Corallococcus sp. CA031C]RKI10478.1 hypothetical protein D7Y13_12625 [Corallococcus praedator]
MRTQPRPPRPEAASDVEVVSTPSVDELVPLFEQALADATSASSSRQVGALNACIDRMSRTEDPEKLAPVLHVLLAKDGVNRLVDEQGVPVGIAATRALLALSYPHPLEVSPERLETLRQFDDFIVPPAPSGKLFFVLAVAALSQAMFFVISHDSPYFEGLSADVLAGMDPASLPPPTLWEQMKDGLGPFWRVVKPAVPWIQFIASALGYLFAVAIADTARERLLARRGFVVLGFLGLAAGFLLPLRGAQPLGTFASAVGALLAAHNLPKPIDRRTA